MQSTQNKFGGREQRSVLQTYIEDVQYLVRICHVRFIFTVFSHSLHPFPYSALKQAATSAFQNLIYPPSTMIFPHYLTSHNLIQKSAICTQVFESVSYLLVLLSSVACSFHISHAQWPVCTTEHTLLALVVLTAEIIKLLAVCLYPEIIQEPKKKGCISVGRFTRNVVIFTECFS